MQKDMEFGIFSHKPFAYSTLMWDNQSILLVWSIDRNVNYTEFVTSRLTVSGWTCYTADLLVIKLLNSSPGSLLNASFLVCSIDD